VTTAHSNKDCNSVFYVNGMTNLEGCSMQKTEVPQCCFIRTFLIFFHLNVLNL